MMMTFRKKRLKNKKLIKQFKKNKNVQRKTANWDKQIKKKEYNKCVKCKNQINFSFQFDCKHSLKKR